MDKDKAIRSAKLTAAGLLDKARARTAVTRAGGQIAPSKYLPNVPRQVHAGGGKVAFQEGNHPLVPPVVYHGTQSDIKTFRQSQTGEFGPGIYMTDLPEEAADYAGTHPFAGKGPNVMPLHLSMKNPFVVKSDPQEFWEKFGGKWDEDAQKNAIAAGHDGVIFRRPYMKWDDSLKREVPTGKHHTHFVAFNPTQVKSAISAQNFDPNDPDITKAGGGSVTDTDEFRNWFGNSVTHTDGDPHVFYTGTSKDKDFTSFNVGRHGAWFTRDPALASQYAEQNDSQGYKQDGWKLTPINTASRVIPAYVKAENPYTGDLPDEVLRSNYKAAQSDWFDTLRRKGHDAWVPARYNGDLVVALKEPQQIKSIFNNGKFDPNQKHMNKAEGGEVDSEEGGAMDENQPNNVVNLGFRRTMRNAMSDEPSQPVQDLMNHVANRFEASRQAYLEAKADGAFDALPFGDRYKYKLTPNSTPMEVVGHRMLHVRGWGSKEPPKLVYQDHYPVVDMEPVGQPAYTRPYPVELLLNNPDKYEFISGKPKLVKRKGGAVRDALALTRRFTKDGTGATMALKPKGK